MSDSNKAKMAAGIAVWEQAIAARTGEAARQLAQNCASKIGAWCAHMERDEFEKLPPELCGISYPELRMAEDKFRVLAHAA